jgi:hypothetical protein
MLDDTLTLEVSLKSSTFALDFAPLFLILVGIEVLVEPRFLVLVVLIIVILHVLRSLGAFSLLPTHVAATIRGWSW